MTAAEKPQADRPEFRYQRLAADIESKIRSGAYGPGDRLPSIRKLKRDLNLSLSTVYQAYVELESMGLVEARPKSGYYVCPPSPDHFPPPEFQKMETGPREVVLSAMVNSVVKAANDPSLLPLGSSVTSPDLLPVKTFSRILKGLSARELRHLMGYALAEGSPELRRRIVIRTMGVLPGLTPEDVVVTSGCMEAVALALQSLLKSGDTLVVESPTFFAFLQLLKEMGILVVEAPTDPKHGVDVGELRRIIKDHPVKACLFMPNFCNPTGALMPEERKRDLVRLLNRHDIPIIEDDLCSELYFGDHRPLPLKAFDQKDLVLTCSSFSKTLAPGFRIGWMIPGRRFKDRILRLKAGMSVAVSSLDQYLVAQYLSTGAYDRHLRRLRAAVKKQVMSAALAVRRHFPPGIRMALPRGGPLLWVELPAGVDGFRVYKKALSRKISTLPGGACSITDQYDRFIRLGCGFPFTSDTEEGIRILGEIIRKRMTG